MFRLFCSRLFHPTCSTLFSAAPIRLQIFFSSSPLRISLCPCCTFLFSVLFLFHTLWCIWKELPFLFSSFFIRLQWVTDHIIFSGNNAADELAAGGSLLQLSTVPCGIFLLTFRFHSSIYSDWRCAISSKFFDILVLSVSLKNLCFLVTFVVSFLFFAATNIAFC